MTWTRSDTGLRHRWVDWVRHWVDRLVDWVRHWVDRWVDWVRHWVATQVGGLGQTLG